MPRRWRTGLYRVLLRLQPAQASEVTPPCAGDSFSPLKRLAHRCAVALLHVGVTAQRDIARNHIVGGLNAALNGDGGTAGGALPGQPAEERQRLLHQGIPREGGRRHVGEQLWRLQLGAVAAQRERRIADLQDDLAACRDGEPVFVRGVVVVLAGAVRVVGRALVCTIGSP